MNTLIEVLFKGKAVSVDLSFLKRYFEDKLQIVLNTPSLEIQSFDELVEILKAETYVDLVINKAYLKIDDKIVKNVFINVTIDHDFIETLFFLDYRDLKMNSSQASIKSVRNWAVKHKECYRYKHMICKSDNGTADEYYFDEIGFGPLFILDDNNLS